MPTNIYVTNSRLLCRKTGKRLPMPIVSDDKKLCYRLAALIATMVLNERSAM